MSVFKQEDKLNTPLDFILLRNGSVNIYNKIKVLDQDIEWLRANSYEIITFDCAQWKNKEQFYQEFSKKMHFPPEYSATNLDSLDDWMGDIEFNGFGKVLVFLNFEHLLRDVEERVALHLLDILELHSRENLLLGDRMIVLLQTNDAGIAIQGFGATSAKWNSKEFLYKDRNITGKDIKLYRYEDLEK